MIDREGADGLDSSESLLAPTRLPDGAVKLMFQPARSPSLGRVVLFTPGALMAGANGATEYVAVIGQVFEDPNNPRAYCNLLVMPPFQPPYWEGSVQERASNDDTLRTWRWPDRT